MTLDLKAFLAFFALFLLLIVGTGSAGHVVARLMRMTAELASAVREVLWKRK